MQKLAALALASIVLLSLNAGVVRCDDEEGEFEEPEFGSKIDGVGVGSDNNNDVSNGRNVDVLTLVYKLVIYKSFQKSLVSTIL